MANPQATQTPASIKSTSTPKNGEPVAPSAITSASSPNAPAESEEEKGSKGAIPRMPVCVIYQEPNGAVVASMIHPAGGEYSVRGRGIGGTTGSLTDDGYPIGPIRVDGPKWIQERIPAGVKVLGFANVQGFPLPKQV